MDTQVPPDEASTSSELFFSPLKPGLDFDKLRYFRIRLKTDLINVEQHRRGICKTVSSSLCVLSAIDVENIDSIYIICEVKKILCVTLKTPSETSKSNYQRVPFQTSASHYED